MGLRLDIARNEARKGNVRLALCVLFLPEGYALEHTEYRKRAVETLAFQSNKPNK